MFSACLVHYLFVIRTSVIDCLGRFIPEMTCDVSSGTLNLTKHKLKLSACTTRYQSKLVWSLFVPLHFAAWYHWHSVLRPNSWKKDCLVL